MSAVVAALAVVTALLSVLVVGLLRSHAEILRALHDLGVNLDDDHDHDDRTFRLRGADEGDDASRRERSGARRAAIAEARDALESTREALDLRTPPPGVVEAQRPVEDPAELGDASDVGGSTPDGEAVAIGVVGAPQPTLLAFLSTGCVTCQDFWDAFAAGVELEMDGRPVRIVAVTKGPTAESPGVVAQLTGDGFTTVMSDEAYDAYGVPVSPYFVLVDAHSAAIAGEGAASSWAQLAGLLDRAVADRGGALGANRTRRELLGGAARQRRVDRELDAAGIGPDHPSLHSR